MYHIALQYMVDKNLAPKASFIRHCAKKALSNQIKSAEMNIRIINSIEMTELNTTYRHKNKPTNVLSFPFSMPENILQAPHLGDVIICAEVVNQEAKEQHKTPEAHWAHIIIHGVFHLLGFDHEDEKEAEVMESLEIKVLQSLGFKDPYQA